MLISEIRKISKNLNDLRINKDLMTLDNLGSDQLLSLLGEHFGKYEGHFLEYERNIGRVFSGRWKVSTRSPLSFRREERLVDGTILLNFDTHSSSGGHKYLKDPIEFAFLNDVFYLGLGKKSSNEEVRIHHQSLYVPVRKI